MREVQTFRQTKDQFKAFLNAVKSTYPLIAPVEKDLVRFEPIKNVDDIHFKHNAYFPLKEYFFKKREVLFSFNGNALKEPSYEVSPRVFFGIRKCDLNAIKHQDMVFIQDAMDPYYKSARKNSYLLGYHCNTAPSPYCFCGSLNLVDYFDLMFYEKEDHFLIEVGSEKGQELIAQFGGYFEASNRLITQDEKIIPGAERLDTKDIKQFYDNPKWKKGVDLCLSCSACTALCPTCYCFDIHDEVKTSNPKEGERIRQWSSCQLPEFSRVAGNHVFREKRDERFKHRIYHQLDYFKDKYGVPLCVGCGRCISGCPTRIDWVGLINEMHNDAKKTNS